MACGGHGEEKRAKASARGRHTRVHSGRKGRLGDGSPGGWRGRLTVRGGEHGDAVIGRGGLGKLLLQPALHQRPLLHVLCERGAGER